MFKGIDETKISSVSQQAKVFYYPGATTKGILNKVKKDSKLLQLDSKRVKKIFLLCVTNSIDNILKVSRSDYTNFIENRNVCEIGLRQSKTEISLLVDFIHDWSSLATINVINILPRESKSRNIVITLKYYTLKKKDVCSVSGMAIEKINISIRRGKTMFI